MPILFKIEKMSSRNIEPKESEKNVFNIAYASALPPKCIYRIKSRQSGKEAIIQIGYHPNQLSQDTVYLNHEMFDFFAQKDPSQQTGQEIELIFLGWAEAGDGDFLNLKSLIVEPEKSRGDILKNGLDKYYIQLGAFEFYQNSYTKISHLLPYLELKPNFYMMRKEIEGDSGEETEAYRVLAGPYTYENALLITQTINRLSKDPVFIKDSKTILKERRKK